MKAKLLCVSVLALGLLLPTSASAKGRLGTPECWIVWPAKDDKDLSLARKVKDHGLHKGDTLMCVIPVRVARKLEDPKDGTLHMQLALKEDTGEKMKKLAFRKGSHQFTQGWKGHVTAALTVPESFDACRNHEIVVTGWGKKKTVKVKGARCR